MQKNQQIATLTIRLLLGFIFFFQGFGKVFTFGLDAVYTNFFKASYADILPDFVLLFTAYYTSFIELIGGFLLIIGLKRDITLYFLASVLVIVTIGHGLKDPIWDLSHVMYRAILLISLLLLPKDYDKFSVDYFISKKIGKAE
ncbi:DoxX family membrane protein [Pseudotenacibaculum sp. MALMAid0570]|uniref:DoxX family membrane protein n=1 Tax=Pseudotenacibaculum sp. MALMAid0570 TaxID=3143938 RepID=UPI0032DF8776